MGSFNSLLSNSSCDYSAHRFPSHVTFVANVLYSAKLFQGTRLGTSVQCTGHTMTIGQIAQHTAPRYPGKSQVPCAVSFRCPIVQRPHLHQASTTSCSTVCVRQEHRTAGWSEGGKAERRKGRKASGPWFNQPTCLLCCAVYQSQ